MKKRESLGVTVCSVDPLRKMRLGNVGLNVCFRLNVFDFYTENFHVLVEILAITRQV